MQSFAVVSLMLFSLAGLVWYVGHTIRERTIGMGRIFGSDRTFRWPDQPVSFVVSLAFYVIMVVLIGWAAWVGLAGLDPPLFALWPGLLGPIAALLLSRRYWGEAAGGPLLETFAAHLRAGERDRARELTSEHAPSGVTRRLLEVGLDVEPVQESAADYRSSAAQRWTWLMDALERALVAERKRAALRLLPAAAAPGACLVFLLLPPRADSTAAWLTAAVETGFAVLVVWLDGRRARRHGEALSVLRAALR